MFANWAIDLVIEICEEYEEFEEYAEYEEKKFHKKQNQVLPLFHMAK